MPAPGARRGPEWKGLLSAGLRPGAAGAARCGCMVAGVSAGHGDSVVVVLQRRPTGAQSPTHACAHMAPRPAQPAVQGSGDPSPVWLSFGHSRGRARALALPQPHSCSFPVGGCGAGGRGWCLGARGCTKGPSPSPDRSLQLSPWESSIVDRLMTPTLSFLARSRSAVTLAGNGKEQGEHLRQDTGPHGSWHRQGTGMRVPEGSRELVPVPCQLCPDGVVGHSYPQCPCAPAQPPPAPSAPATTTACSTAAGRGGRGPPAAPT